MPKYNIYIICKTEDDFLEKSKEFDKYRAKICHIQWIPAEYLKLTQCNKKLLKDLNTRWNTVQKKILAKLGTIAAHRKALLAIYMNKTDNNIVLEADATLSLTLPSPPAVSCYLGGWIIPPQITKAGEVKINIPRRVYAYLARRGSDGIVDGVRRSGISPGRNCGFNRPSGGGVYV